ncbi:hypothetical protein SDC9_97170 [bioreactor metagenome]|uniref:Uncharacterized protein n=1 Tax=bioreactor metagenome TaxID=1076179 RepID=A0A645ADS4_9ZZZZ
MRMRVFPSRWSELPSARTSSARSPVWVSCTVSLAKRCCSPVRATRPRISSAAVVCRRFLCRGLTCSSAPHRRWNWAYSSRCLAESSIQAANSFRCRGSAPASLRRRNQRAASSATGSSACALIGERSATGAGRGSAVFRWRSA